MIASRYPIMEVSFHPTTHKRSLWQHAICYGIIMAKVDLGGQKVGYMANLHNVAYQGTEDLIGMQRQLITVLGLVAAYPKLFVPRSESFMIVSKNQDGFLPN